MPSKKTDDKVLAKVQKLLKLTGSTNSNEAAAALAKANEIMAAEGVSLVDVQRAEIGETKVKSTQSVSKPKDWELALVVAVGRAFACKVLWQPGSSYKKDYWGRYIFVGHNDHIALAEFASVSLLRQLVKAKANRNKELNKAGRLGARVMGVQLNGFCWGWVEVVAHKVETFAKETSPKFRKLIEDFCAEQTAGRTAKNRASKYDEDALDEGRAAAGRVEIHRPMTRADEMRKIGN